MSHLELVTIVVHNYDLAIALQFQGGHYDVAGCLDSGDASTVCQVTSVS